MPWTDARTGSVRDLDTVYTFQAPKTKAEWLERAAKLRQQILLSAGLYPFPGKTPLNVRFHSRVERDGYSMERISFESRPGFYVAGNLYRPLGRKGPFPGVLNPHGHTSNGRLANSENFASQGRCIMQAKLGMVAFSYDMVGYNDSFQLQHAFATNDTPEGRELALWGISPMGLQLYNSIRCVDFLQSLPDVDPERIGCTGESGGGTQTFLLAAVDDRVKASAPVNMVSGQMQGGCICENGPGLRLGTNNIEIAALCAPRDQLLVACTYDWTANTPLVEFPGVQSVYRLLGKPRAVSYHQHDADHNYDRESREAVYSFLANPLKAEGRAKTGEQAFKVEPDEELLVFSKEKPGALTGSELLERMKRENRQRGDALRALDAKDAGELKEQLAPMFRIALGDELPKLGEAVLYNPSRSLSDGYIVRTFAIGRKGVGDKAPARLFTPAVGDVRGRVLVVHPEGPDAVAPDGKPGPLVSRLLSTGHEVMALKPLPAASRGEVKYFDTYNRTDAAEAVHDILTAWGYLRERGKEPVSIVGLKGAGLQALLAAAAASDEWTLAGLCADIANLDSTSDSQLVERAYVPCLRMLGGIEAAAALVAPGRLRLFNAGAFDASWAEAAHVSHGTGGGFSKVAGALLEDEVAAWLAD